MRLSREPIDDFVFNYYDLFLGGYYKPKDYLLDEDDIVMVDKAISDVEFFVSRFSLDERDDFDFYDIFDGCSYSPDELLKDEPEECEKILESLNIIEEYVALISQWGDEYNY